MILRTQRKLVIVNQQPLSDGQIGWLLFLEVIVIE